MGLVAGTLQPVYSACVTTVMSPMHAMQRPIRWLKAIQRSAATISGGPPFGYDHCVATIDEPLRRELDLTSWDCAFVGAEPVRVDTVLLAAQHAVLLFFAGEDLSQLRQRLPQDV